MIHSKDKIQLNIKKAMGTLAKVQKMIDDDVYCADVAHQINASMGLLQSANRELLKNHLSCCGQRLSHQSERKKKTLSKNWFGLGMLQQGNNLPFPT